MSGLASQHSEDRAGQLRSDTMMLGSSFDRSPTPWATIAYPSRPWRCRRAGL